MSVLNWLTSRFGSRGKALALYRRGKTLARKRDHEGAIKAYSATIGLPTAPIDVKAIALYYRALVHVAAGDDRKGVDDLGAILAMDEALVMVNIKTMARQKIASIETRLRENDVSNQWGYPKHTEPLRTDGR